MEQRDWAGAAEIYARLSRHSWPEAAGLSMIKRGRALARMSGWSGPHAQAALDAWKKAPDSRGLALLAAEALLDADRAPDALEAVRSLRKGEAAPALCAAVFLAASSAGARLDAGDWAFLASFLSQPEYLERAALEALNKGERPRAAAYLSEAQSKGLKASSGLLYACGYYEACILSLGTPPHPASGAALLRADALFRLGRELEAGRIWREAADYDGLPIGVYLNAAASTPDLDEKLAFLDRGEAAASASERPHFSLARASALLEAGRALEAKVLIYSLGGWKGEDSARSTLALAAEAEGRDYDRVEALCLSAAETSRADPILRRWSVRRMMELGRGEAAVKLLSMTGGEADPWLLFARAALAAARDGNRAPLEALAASPELRYAQAAAENLEIMDGRDDPAEGME